MHRPFEQFDHFLHVVEVVSLRKTEIDGSYHEGFALCFGRGAQPQAKKMIYGFFEGFPRAPGLLTQLPGDVLIESKSSSHIMMLAPRHHDVNDKDIMMPPESQRSTPAD